jgi:REP element-mobilizing transposase RayT
VGYDFNFNANRHRRSARLKGHNYGWGATYFITIVTYGRVCWFGDIADSTVELNMLGEEVRRNWLSTPSLRRGVELGPYVVMPNHLHAIVRTPRSTHDATTELDDLGRPVVRQTLGSIIRGFKSSTTSRLNKIRQMDEPGRIWQRNYHEHVIRNQAEYRHIADYIRANPARWAFDQEMSMPCRMSSNGDSGSHWKSKRLQQGRRSRPLLSVPNA